MGGNGVRGVAALAASLAFGLLACTVKLPTDSSSSGSPSGGSTTTGGSGGGGGSGGSSGSLSAKCSGCPRQPPELHAMCLSVGAVCGYEGQSALRMCVDIGAGTGFWTDPMTGSRYADTSSCPDAKPKVGSACQFQTDACIACYYNNGCEKPTTTMFCDPGSATWIPSPMDATNPQITHCTPGSDASTTRADSGAPDLRKADAASDPNLCSVSGQLPTCVCTYPDKYAGYVICGYGSNTDPDHSYIWPKSDARYWGREVTCAPKSLCELAKRCDSDPTKLCCSPNDSGTWNIECKFADPASLARHASCCR